MQPTPWHMLFATNAVLLVLLAFSFPFIERGSGAYVLAVASLVMIGIMTAGVLAIIYSGWRPFTD